MADFKAKHSGTWKTGEPWAKHSGTWKAVQEIWRKESGSWVRIWQDFDADLSGLPASLRHIDISPNVAEVSLSIRANGTWNASANASYSGTWMVRGVNSDFQVRVTKTSGTATPSGTLGSWLSLTSDRSWTLQKYGTGSSTCTILVEIRSSSTSEVLTSKSITLEATIDL